MSRLDPPGERTLGVRSALPRPSLEGPSPEVARRLLGCLLVRTEDDGTETIVRIVETEAYRQDDPASHSHRGVTPRNEVMFGPAGHAYVYFTYGMHHCVNVVTGPAGEGAAALLRAGIVLRGGIRVRGRRGPRHRERDLVAGPGRLCQALAIDRAFDGIDLLDPAAALRLERDGWSPDEERVVAGPRVGIRLAHDVPWRFHLDGVPEVSRYTRHPRAPGDPAG